MGWRVSRLFYSEFPFSVPRGELTDPLLEAVRALPESWSIFGLTPTTFSAGTFSALLQK